MLQIEFWVFYAIPLISLIAIFASIKPKETPMKWHHDIVGSSMYHWLVLTECDIDGNQYTLEFYYSHEEYGIKAQYKNPKTIIYPGLYKNGSGHFSYHGAWN